MSMWAAVKHAINSTLGTSYFRPLDNIIVGGKQIIADEEEINCYIPMITSQFVGRAYPDTILVAKFRTRCPGSFYVEVTGDGRQEQNETFIPFLCVSVNGVETYRPGDWKLFEPRYGGDRVSFQLPYTAYGSRNYALLSNVPANALIEVRYYCSTLKNGDESFLNLTNMYLKGRLKEVFAEGVTE